MPAIVTIWLTMSYLLTSQWLTQSMVSKILHRKHFVYDSELWERRGPDLGKIHTFSRFFGERPFWYVFWNGFWIRKDYWQHYFSLETQAWINVFLDRGWGVNIFLPVFKSLKFSLQYEILKGLKIFLQINRANYALVVAKTNFHFQTSLNQFWIPVKATCFFMVQNHWYVQ